MELNTLVYITVLHICTGYRPTYIIMKICLRSFIVLLVGCGLFSSFFFFFLDQPVIYSVYSTQLLIYINFSLLWCSYNG